MTKSECVMAVQKEIDRLEERLVQTLIEIVRIPSVTPSYPGQSPETHAGRESDVSRLIGQVYREAGARVDLFEVEPHRQNAVGVVKGVSHGRSLILNGHVDVVPADDCDKWTDGRPFGGRMAEGRIWGRGAADMKGGVVAAAYAALALSRAGVRLGGDLILEAVVGEETGDRNVGTGAAIARGYTADAAIVGEPSSLKILPASMGVFWFTLTVPGLTAHLGQRGRTIHPTGDGPAIGVNAIDKGFYMYRALRELEDEWALTKRHPLFENGSFGILPAVVAGSPEGVSIPFSLADSMRFEYCVMSHPGDDAESVAAAIEDRVTKAADLDPWLREHPPEVSWRLDMPGIDVAADAPIVRALSAAHSDACEGTRFAGAADLDGLYGSCDASWLAQAGIPSIVYGPGAIAVAHHDDESVEIDEVVACCRAYALAAMNWCGVASS